MDKIFFGFLFGLLVLMTSACTSMPQNVEKQATKQGIVLVAGATGRTGRLIVNQLLDEGYQIRVFVRNAAKAKNYFGEKVKIAVGDVRDQQQINQAMKGVRWVFSAIGAGGSKDPNNLPEFVDYGGTKGLVEAAVREKVDRFIMVSSRSAGKVDHFLNRRHNNVLIWKMKAENLLRASGLVYTIVRPGGLTDEAGNKHAILAFESAREDIKLRRISRADVATICVAALNRKSTFSKTFAIVNDPAEGIVPLDQIFAPIKDYKY